ncbi:hypothetical protein BgiBS90_014178, partial [Biomphalaria glabrata]
MTWRPVINCVRPIPVRWTTTDHFHRSRSILFLRFPFSLVPELAGKAWLENQ